MKVSYNWIKQYLDLEVPAKDLAEKIERTSVEVDGVTRPEAGLKKVVVGHVLSLTNHPDSDHLHICQVDVGEEHPLHIVCGAPNVAADQKVIVALVGARIGNNVKIKRSKMRGELSEGMICSLQEIGFDSNVVPKEFADGIYVLPADAVPGEAVFGYLGMDDDLIDLDVTPNRGDMLSLNGTLHDLAAMYDLPLTLDTPTVTESGAPAAEALTLDVDDALAPIYQMRLIRQVTIAPSPLWLQVRLWNAGIRPINNVVDATNYIMLQYGQPLHAFDYDKFGSQAVQVRTARSGEQLTTLDDAVHELDPDDIVIANEAQPIALAGVMGGQSTEITDETTTVVIEAAVFDATRVRKTAQRHHLHTDAAQRFERGVDQGGVTTALDAAAALLTDLAAGQVATGILVGSQALVELPVINVTLTRINDVLGTSLDEETVTGIFKRLGLTTQVENGQYQVTVPSRRWDLHIEADLFEEVARIYGYDQLPATLPTGAMTIGALTPKQRFIRATRQSLQTAGLNQAISYSLTTAEKAQMFTLKSAELTQLSWPMSVDHAVLRMNLIAGLLDDVAYNAARKVKNVAMYEQGRVFYRTVGQVRPDEEEHVAAVITGDLTSKTWHSPAIAADFYVLKGILETYLRDMAVTGPVTLEPSAAHPEMHPGRTADVLVHGHTIGFIGQIHPRVQKQFKIGTTYAFELNLQALLDMPKTDDQFKPIAKFPAITRDIAMVVADEVTNEQVVALIKKRGGAYLQDVQLFDVYAGEHVPDQHKSLAYSLRYQDPHGTLVDEVVTQAFDKVVRALQQTFDAEIR